MIITIKNIACPVEIDVDSLQGIDTENPYHHSTLWAREIAERYKDYWIPEPQMMVAGGERETFGQDTLVIGQVVNEVCRILEGR
jgi:hypothetical protein